MVGGIDVRLPEAAPKSAWRRLAVYQREHGLLDKEVESIDMRLADRLIVKPAPHREGSKANSGNDDV